MGGTSSERDVSLASGLRIAEALRTRGHSVRAIDTALGPLTEADERSMLAAGVVKQQPPTPGELARMKPSAYLINVGRGASVDEPALAQALRAGRLAGAAVDVFAEEPPPAGHSLYACDTALVSPHVSGFLPSYDDRCTDLFAENLRRWLAGAPLLNLVDRARGY